MKFLQKILFLFLISFCLFIGGGKDVFAKENRQIYLNFFYETSASHYLDEQNFLKSISKKYPLVIQNYDLSQKDNRELLDKLVEKYQIKTTSLPVLFIGQDAISGFVSRDLTGVEIENTIKKHLSEKQCIDIVKKYQEECAENTQYLKVPFLGKVNLMSLSLPTLTVVLGTLDGFNPCSMWALLALLALLIATKSRKKLIVFGGLFILISSISYFLFMTAWLKVFQWITYIEITKIIIGLAAFIAAGYYIRDWWINRPGCKVTSSKTKSKILKKMEWIIHEASIPAAVIGIIFLAFSVNLIELLCTIGLPAIYTRILTLQSLPAIQYYLYLIFYGFFYMLLNLIIYGIAIATFSLTSISPKYQRYLNLAGAIILIILGVYLLFLK
jgi:hypothetical protein